MPTRDAHIARAGDRNVVGLSGKIEKDKIKGMDPTYYLCRLWGKIPAGAHRP